MASAWGAPAETNGLHRRGGGGGGAGSVLKKIDAFRALPIDMTEASGIGGVMTIVAAVACAVLFICELNAFTHSEHVTNVNMDTSRDSDLPVYMNVVFWDIPCEFLEVGVYDTFGADRLITDASLEKKTMARNEKGEHESRPYREEEVAALEADEMDQTLTETEKEDLDADWTSTSDVFEHTDFKSVVKSHDIVMVNFYADWCGHCRHFAPTWVQFKTKTEADDFAPKVVLSDGKTRANFKVLRLNCVAFQGVCQEQGIQAFPTVRAYLRSGAIEEYEGAREISAMQQWLIKSAGHMKRATNVHHHSMFKEGCQVIGTINVQRVPGVLHFEVKRASLKQNINRALTNVSHTVNRLMFGVDNQDRDRRMATVPSFLAKSMEPLNGQTFFVERFHEAPKHFLKVVSAIYQPSRFSEEVQFYTIAHQSRTSSFKQTEIPQAQFHFDIAPIEIRVSMSERKWYDFITALLAIIGGTYTIMGVLTGAGNLASKHFKGNIGKLG
jgi:thiol-disulfide isomerase/thioredoxin